MYFFGEHSEMTTTMMNIVQHSSVIRTAARWCCMRHSIRYWSVAARREKSASSTCGRGSCDRRSRPTRTTSPSDVWPWTAAVGPRSVLSPAAQMVTLRSDSYTILLRFFLITFDSRWCCVIVQKPIEILLFLCFSASHYLHHCHLITTVKMDFFVVLGKIWRELFVFMFLGEN